MKSRPLSIQSVLLLAGCVALAASGCSSGSSLSLSATTTALGADDGGSDGGHDDAGTSGDAGVQPDGGSGGISLCGQLLVQRVRLVVRRIDLERSAAPADAGMPDGGLASCECPDGGTVCVKGDDVHVGPFLVDLAGTALDGGIHQVFDVAIPSGTYEDVRFTIDTLSRHQTGADGGLSEMKDLHASIVADGTFGGAPFQFVTPIHIKQKQQGPFTVGDGTNTIVLTVDPARWFIGDDGRVLDPRASCNRGAILANIRCSVRAGSDTADGGMHFRKEFDDDDGEDRCRADDDGADVEDRSMMNADEHGDGGDHGHQRCAPATLTCGDAGMLPPDAGR